MADTKLTGLTENTAPLGSDLAYIVDDPAGSPASQKIYMGSANLLPNGFMINGKIQVTVASNNLTVALKTLGGGDPSTTDPVSVWINGSFRRCTAALSVTKNAGTNWCNAGSAELATKEIDHFVYLIWNTTPATDIMDIGFSRIPYGRVYSDFSGTSTNEKYLAQGNGSAPTATDDVVNVGRFAATLSAGAGYTWSVPTYTSINLIQSPIYETRWLTYTPTWSAGAMTINNTTTSTVARYRIIGNVVYYLLRWDGTTSISAANTISATRPFTPTYAGTPVFAVGGAAFITDSTNFLGGSYMSASDISFIKYDQSNFGLGAGRSVSGNGWYEI